MTVRRGTGRVCLDFGCGRLAALEAGDHAVSGWTSLSLPERAVRHGDPVNPEALAEVLRHSLVAAGIQATSSRLALPDEASVSRLVTLPAMRGRDLRRAMAYTAERYLPFPIDRASWSWDVVERSARTLKIYLVAAWSDVVDRYAAAMRLAGLNPELVEPRSISVARAINLKRAVVLEAGRQRLHLTLLLDSEPPYVDEALLPGESHEREEAVERLLRRAWRQSGLGGDATSRSVPIVLAGASAQSELPPSVPGQPVAELLNGHLPAFPRGFPAAAFLPNLGLAIR